MVTQIKSIMDETNQNYKSVSHPTIFHSILDSDLSPQEKELSRLAEEGQTVVGAGTETTAWTMSVITYHVLSNPQVKDRLQNELRSVMSTGKATCNQLEQLPYFSAIISEGLRLSHGVSTHLQRVSPDQVLKFQEWEIPPGVSYSQSFGQHIHDIKIDSSQYDICSHSPEPINFPKSKRVHTRPMD